MNAAAILTLACAPMPARAYDGDKTPGEILDPLEPYYGDPDGSPGAPMLSSWQSWLWARLKGLLNGKTLAMRQATPRSLAMTHHRN
jgi:hypothetical protein